MGRGRNSRSRSNPNRRNRRDSRGRSRDGPGKKNFYSTFNDNYNPQNNSTENQVEAPPATNFSASDSKPNLQNSNRQRNDARPDVERRKGGVKLFVGRVPQEAPEQLIRKTFERFGSVLEVFKMRGEKPGEERHSLYHEDGLTCAFVRMRDVPSAEDAIASLHDQERLLPNRRDTGPIQVAYAKGEAIRLGLEATREALPNRLEGKELVRQLKERLILDSPDQQSFKFSENGNPFWFPTDPLIDIINTGRKRDRMFESCWRHYCSEGWGGTYELKPELMCHHGLVQFVMMRTVDYGDAEWFLNMVKSTHNKLKSGELQSSQRRNLTSEQCYATSCVLERPGDPVNNDPDAYDVVARHAEIVRNRKIMENQGVVPGQGPATSMPVPGQGETITGPPPGQPIPQGQPIPGQPFMNQNPVQQGGKLGMPMQGIPIAGGVPVGMPGQPIVGPGQQQIPGPGTFVPGQNGPGVTIGKGTPPVAGLPPPVHVPGFGTTNAQNELLTQQNTGQVIPPIINVNETPVDEAVAQAREDVDYSDI